MGCFVVQVLVEAAVIPFPTSALVVSAFLQMDQLVVSELVVVCGYVAYWLYSVRRCTVFPPRSERNDEAPLKYLNEAETASGWYYNSQ